MRFLATGLLVLSIVASSPFLTCSTVAAADKDETLAAFSTFVGKWKFVATQGALTCTRTPGGKFLFENDGEANFIVGWDSSTNTLMSTGFSPDGRAFVDQLKITDVGSTFRVDRVYGPKDGFPMTVTYTKDQFEMVDANGEKVVARRPTIESHYLVYFKKLVEKYDANADGSLESSEWTKMSKNPEEADVDNNGRITVEECARWWLKR